MSHGREKIVRSKRYERPKHPLEVKYDHFSVGEDVFRSVLLHVLGGIEDSLSEINASLKTLPALVSVIEELVDRLAQDQTFPVYSDDLRQEFLGWAKEPVETTKKV